MTDRRFRVLSALVFFVLAVASAGCMGSLGSEPATPQTLGPRAVGVTTMRVEDETRDRDLMVEVWYPAAQRSSSAPVVYSVAAMGTTVARLRSIAGAHRDAAAVA